MALDKRFLYGGILALAMTLGACAPQSTPSMMNTSRAELVHSTAIEQIALDRVDDVTLTLLADDYRRHGNGPLELAMAYDPSSRNFTAMQARNKLREVEANLRARGIGQIATRTIAVPKGTPALMVSYESFEARAPQDCHTMPGIDDYRTTRDIADYRFGCSTESLIARQIARPADLIGREGSREPHDGRRAVNVIEEHRNYGGSEANKPLEKFGSGNIGN